MTGPLIRISATRLAGPVKGCSIPAPATDASAPSLLSGQASEKPQGKKPRDASRWLAQIAWLWRSEFAICWAVRGDLCVGSLDGIALRRCRRKPHGWCRWRKGARTDAGRCRLHRRLGIVNGGPIHAALRCCDGPRVCCLSKGSRSPVSVQQRRGRRRLAEPVRAVRHSGRPKHCSRLNSWRQHL